MFKFRFFFSLLFLSPFSPFLKTALPESSVNLVDIYCHEVIYWKLNTASAQRNLAVTDVWAGIVKRLETREIRTAVENEGIPLELHENELKSCVEQNYEEFEVAEFSLRGLELIKEHQKEESRSVERPIKFEGKVSLPLVGDINFRPGQVLSTQYDPSSLNSREEKYGKLWEKFVGGLRQRSASFLNTVQLVKNFD